MDDFETAHPGRAALFWGEDPSRGPNPRVARVVLDQCWHAIRGVPSVNISWESASRAPWDKKEKTPTVLGCGLLFILGMGFMAALQTLVLPSQANRSADKPRTGIDAARMHQSVQTSVSQGGEFEYMRLPLEEPKAFLPDTSQPLPPPRWVFANYTRRQLANLISGCDFTEQQRRSLLEAAHPQPSLNGMVVQPPPNLVLEMSRSARQKVYSILSKCPSNSAQCHPFRFRADVFEQWCAEADLSGESLQVLRKLSYPQAGSMCFCDGAVAQSALPPEEFHKLVKSLYGERTFIMRLLIRPETDIEGITRYWSKGGRIEAIRPLLESMRKIPGGAGLNISFLLPSFAESRLYTYADPSDDADGTRENCFWSAMNFFNERPDPRFVSATESRRTLAQDYNEVEGSPAYGDIVTLENANGAPVHMCVYLADQVVFTKNGSDHMQPWVLMKMADVLAYYNSRESATMRVYRSRKQ